MYFSTEKMSKHVLQLSGIDMKNKNHHSKTASLGSDYNLKTYYLVKFEI